MNDENKQTIADLEAEVRKELGITTSIQNTADPVATPPHATNDLTEKLAYLETLKGKIDTKITGMEGDVKTQLTEVKKIKETIEEEIKKIKHLEETKETVDTEIAKIKTLEETKQKIEQEVASLEQTMNETL